MLQGHTGNGEDKNSCDTACGNANTLFGSSEAMWDCMTLAALWQASNAYRRGDDQVRMTQTALKGPEPNISQVKPLTILAFDGEAVFRLVSDCAQRSYFEDGPDCDMSIDDAPHTVPGDVQSGSPFLSRSFGDGAQAVANLDIAGPGVSDPANLSLISMYRHSVKRC